MPAHWPSSGRIRSAGLLLAVALVGGWSLQGGAAETIRILAAGAAQGVVLRLEPDMAAAAAAKLDAVFDTVGALRAGDPPDSHRMIGIRRVRF